MSDDPRGVFRMPAKNCGSCAYWPDHLIDMVSTRPMQPVELPCAAIESKMYDPKADNYANGWRRASDCCGAHLPRRKVESAAC